jgi:hypothetical protein
MSYQIQIQKALTQIDFLTTTIHEKNDLTNMIRDGDRFVIRQGDLIVTNYHVDMYRKRGLRKAYIYEKNGVKTFMGSHYILSLQDNTILIHNEHGIVVIPKPMESLHFYTFDEAGD